MLAGEPKRQVKTRVKYVDVPVPSPPKIIERTHEDWGNNFKGGGLGLWPARIETKESKRGQNFRGELKPNKDVGLEVMDFLNLEIGFWRHVKFRSKMFSVQFPSAFTSNCGIDRSTSPASIVTRDTVQTSVMNFFMKDEGQPTVHFQTSFFS